MTTRRDFLLKIGATAAAMSIPVQTTAQRVSAEVTRFSQGNLRFFKYTKPVDKTLESYPGSSMFGWIENRAGETIAYVDRALNIFWRSDRGVSKVFQK